MADRKELSSRELIEGAKKFAQLDRYSLGTPFLWLFTILLLLVVEWFFAPLELSLAKYMTWTRSVRPEVGQGWELNKEGAEAKRKLGQIGQQIDEKKAATATLANWVQLPDLLEKHQAISISPQRFLTLYADLPEGMGEKLIPQIELLQLRSEGHWHRVFFMRGTENLRVYLVDSHNVVLRNKEISWEFFDILNDEENSLAATLDDLPEFVDTIFPADLFFQLVSLGGTIHLESFNSEWLTQVSGKLVRVGISEQFVLDMSPLGFEFETERGMVVRKLWIPLETANQLRDAVQDQAILTTPESMGEMR
ncbi:hypothetical protein K8I28_15515 [bacterium]|nr:hypothetical protein [bacterium]